MKLAVPFTFILIFFVYACSGKSKRLKEMDTSKGFIEFKQDSYSFGELTEGDVVGHRFKCFNSGVEPVHILHVDKTCGCTDVKYSKKPILPGDTTYVELIFDTKGWSGRQVKQVKVITNDSLPVKELRIWADIK